MITLALMIPAPFDIIVRSAVVYLAIVLGLRLLGKRPVAEGRQRPRQRLPEEGPGGRLQDAVRHGIAGNPQLEPPDGDCRLRAGRLVRGTSPSRGRRRVAPR